MAQVINESTRIANIKIRAVPSEGQVLDTTHFARDVAELFAADIEGTLRERIPQNPHVETMRALIRGTIERRLSEMLVVDTPAAAAESNALPVANLKPSEVVEQKLVPMSIASLYRSVDGGKFYCVRPRGQTNGRVFPAWQFVGVVPTVLPAVLEALQGALETEVHAFFVTARVELNELAPAELLAGKLFEGRSEPHASQRRLLLLPATERQRRVIDAIPQAGEGVAY
ncbi:hypothetical protein [Burkholderia gladioli]|uniref:hypothetical protein n=1 Tax=Burkholderia gladioli TaxID=28095 RepID=UPI0016406CB3|nr:hypothetical protein [Burkholderia gladioli]